MLIAFTDESYSENRYFQVAFVIDVNHLGILEHSINLSKQYAKRFSVDPSTEIHGYSIMNHTDGWEALEGKIDGKISIYKSLLRNIAQTPGVILIQGVDINAVAEKYHFPHPPEQISHRHLLDMLDRYATNRGETMYIFSDEAPQQKILGELFWEYKESSTGGWYPRKLTSILQIDYINSQAHVGIQVADVIAYLYRRMEDHYRDNPYERGRLMKMWEILDPCIHPWYQPRIWP